MSLAAAARANNRSQLNTVTEIKYSSRNNTARDHSMIPVRGETPVHGPRRSFGTVHPVADLLLRWIDNRDNTNTTTNPNSRWPFPGRRAGQPMNAGHLSALINKLGIPTIAGRSAAIRQHVLEMPAPVVADAPGYHPVTTAKLAAQAGDTWNRYAPGDHSRPPRTGDS
jgi:hypothetical protein